MEAKKNEVEAKKKKNWRLHLKNEIYGLFRDKFRVEVKVQAKKKFFLRVEAAWRRRGGEPYRKTTVNFGWRRVEARPST